MKRVLLAALAACMVGFALPAQAMAATSSQLTKKAGTAMAQQDKAAVKAAKAGTTTDSAAEGIEGLDQTTDTYPAAFDLRACSPDKDGDGYLEPNGTTSYVTSVKFQNPWGTCWAFGAIAACETSYLSATNTPAQDAKGNDTIDLSEKQLAYFAYTPLPADSSTGQGGEGTTFLSGSVYNAGGNSSRSRVSLMGSGIGPTLESADPQLYYAGLALNSKGEKTNSGTLCLNYFKLRFSTSTAKLVAPNGEAHTWTEWSDYEGHPDWYEYFQEWSAKLGGVSAIPFITYAENPDHWQNITSDDYWTKFVGDDWTIDESLRFTSSLELLEGSTLPCPNSRDDDGNYHFNRKANNILKSELLKGRAIDISFSADSSRPSDNSALSTYLNTETWAHYTYDGAFANHDVTIVGWDDNYSASNFLSEIAVKDEDDHVCYNEDGSLRTKKVSQPPADGAWIVKNSWGSIDSDADNQHTWGVDGSGYFYISYYDTSLGQPASYQLSSTIKTDIASDVVGQYDYSNAAAINDFSLPLQRISAANVFTAKTTTKVGSLGCATATANNKVTFKLYRMTKGATNPTKGKLLKTVTKTYDYAGFHRVSLGRTYKFAKGTKYSVVVTIKDASNNTFVCYPCDYDNEYLDLYDKVYSYPVESSSNTVIHKGESYILSDGEVADWSKVVAICKAQDKSAYGCTVYTVDNPCIRAYSSVD